ncbi:Heat shock protein 15 [Listeria grayi]|uniref:RQC P-site tRNA stabilizing factor n=3 Tax=Listeria grayi TaxID=1641 RepID=D7UUH9_LISGR|nr:RNA-binding S4 domain-containing protein [Listeria grayi]EFI84905.1 S4 domain protein [Listeria grayi DSM 20601]MBC1922169.1 RNA-binding S4 domain-containing protein [Listeria grayi]STY44904.1 Heat shock protein 15 [Listeria grayi]VEI30849.1 Heat shock protein 15 [Listeria grayi]
MAETMRLDKFLKVSRLIKRRTVAKEVAEKGRIEVNGNVAKPGTNIKVNDELVIRFGPKTVTAKVERLEEHTRKETATEMYTIISEKRNDEE